jgi:3-phenylpropionate/trans-cinnamate dioxygenase ferredoxin subunit
VKHVIGPVDDIKPEDPTKVVIGRHKICVVRIGDAFYAVGDTCTHADVSLSEGELDVETKHIECWKHGSCFSLETGEPDVLPAVIPEPVYAIWVEGHDLCVEISE